MGFPGSSDSKESAYNAGDPGLISGSGRFPRGGSCQYSCLENLTEEPARTQSIVLHRVGHN